MNEMKLLQYATRVHEYLMKVLQYVHRDESFYRYYYLNPGKSKQKISAFEKCFK
jgi:hypothetical protein